MKMRDLREKKDAVSLTSRVRPLLWGSRGAGGSGPKANPS